MNYKLKYETRKYIKAVKQYLFTDRKTKREFLSGLEQNIDDFIETNNITNFKAVISFFGEPEDVAKDFIYSSDLNKIKVKRNVAKTASILCITAILVWFFAAAGVAVSNIKSADTYSIEEVIVMEEAI